MSLWVPIHEVGIWGYSPFYVAAKMLDLKQQMKDTRPILLHCHAGVNRSRCVAHAVLSAEGNCQKEIDELDVLRLFALNQQKGYIPEDIHLMIVERKKYDTYSIHGLNILSIIKTANQNLNLKALNFNVIAQEIDA